MSANESKAMSGSTIAVIVIVSILVLVLISVLAVQMVNSSSNVGTGASNIVVAPAPVPLPLPPSPIPTTAGGAGAGAGANARPAVNANANPHQQHQQMQAQARARFMQQAQAQQRAANSRISAAQGVFNAPYARADPMPQAQLNAAPVMPQLPNFLPGVPSSSNVGEVNQEIMSTEVYGTTANPYNEQNYMEDPAMLTPSSATDIRGIDTFMPNFDGTVGTVLADGETGNQVDPSTGLPTFTPGQLMRSQLLGGQGAGSFLRREQDPLSGLRKTVGRNMNGPQVVRRDLEVRRVQINAARLQSPTLEIGSDFNNGEFMVN